MSSLAILGKSSLSFQKLAAQILMISFNVIFTNKESPRSRPAIAKIGVLLINFKCTMFSSLSVSGQKAQALRRGTFASSNICKIFKFRVDKFL